MYVYSGVIHEMFGLVRCKEFAFIGFNSLDKLDPLVTAGRA